MSDVTHHPYIYCLQVALLQSFFSVFIFFSIQDDKHQEFMDKTADRIKTEVSPAYTLKILKKNIIENILESIFIEINMLFL